MANSNEAMREALERTDLFLSALGKWLKVNDEGQEYALAAGVIHTLVEHALAKPPRNCDKYANHNDAMRAFEAFVREQGKLGFINPYTESFKWLFAPANEKGGNDGSK